MNKIQKLSRFFKIVFAVIFWGWPIVLLLIWFQNQDDFLANTMGLNIVNFLSAYIAPEHFGHPLSLIEKIAGFMVSCIPAAISMLIAFSLMRLFDCYQRGIIFALESIQYIRRVGIIMFIWAALNPLYQALICLVVTLNNPHGQRLIAITLDSNYFRNLITAGIVFLIASIMQEAVKLQDEQKLII